MAAVYAAVNQESTVEGMLGLDDKRWSLWGSTDFEEQLRVADRRYIKARIFVQALVQPGMLISEDLLATRLGIDCSFSAGWDGLREALSDVFIPALPQTPSSCGGLEGWKLGGRKDP